MKLQPYTSYKSLDIEWNQSAPSHWRSSRLKFDSYIKARVGWHGLKSDEFTEEGPYLITGSDFSGKVIDWSKCYHCEVERYEQDPYIQLKDDDLLITKDGTIGKVILTGKLPDKATLNSGVFVLRPLKERYDTKYYYWLMQSSVFHGFVEYYRTGSTIAHLYQETFCNLPYAIPPLDEQAQIATFLDRETAKIDRLIEKQQRLIELLEEKRQAVISDAVTKGLNKDAPMKDSGVEWLGSVPEHWVVSKFGYLSLVVRGGSPRPAGDPTLFNGDYSPWVTVAEITKDNELYLESTETFLTKLGSEQCRVFKSGTLLLSNSGATLGVPKILRINANANDGVVGFECLSPKLDIEFAYYYLASLTDNLRDRINQGSGQPNLNTDLVKDISLPLPSLEEQKAIVDYVKLTLTKLGSIKSSSKKMMILLQERRTALISAAVTGKIDVRDRVPQDVEEAVAS